MEDMQFTSLMIGIISSLVATAIFILMSEVFRRVLLPWFADKIYQGVRIDGTWKLELNNTDSALQSGELKLEQWGNKIKGIYYHEINGSREFYNISGSISNMYLMYTCVPTSNRKIDAAAALLHIVEGDECNLNLVGNLLYQSHGGKVSSWDDVKFALTSS